MGNERKNKMDSVCPMASLVYAGDVHHYYDGIFIVASILFNSTFFGS